MQILKSQILKSVALVFVCGLFFAQTQAVTAAEKTGFYLSGALGAAIPNTVDGKSGTTSYTIDYEYGAFVSGALGYRVSKNLRVEAEISTALVGLDNIKGNGASVTLSGDVDTVSYTANVFFDIETENKFTPYIGGGFGLVRWDIGTVTATLNGTSVTAAGVDGTDLTAFGEIGFSYAISDTIDIVPAYRYQWFDTGTSNSDSDTAHILKIGLRLAF